MCAKCECRNCNKRQLACHDTCESYLNWKKECAELNEKKRQAEVLSFEHSWLIEGYYDKRNYEA